MEDLSEAAIKANCPHCDVHSQAFVRLLEETNNFHIVCDAHPICEGHILIIPKQHHSCIAEYPDNVYEEFVKLNDKVLQFLKNEYNSASTFEHGIFGQTVYHSHIHYLPFNGRFVEIIPEGESRATKFQELSELKDLYLRDGGYLYFSIAENIWSVDVKISKPRFFRDRFAKALGRSERGNWKEMHVDKDLMRSAEREFTSTKRKWENYTAKLSSSL